MKMIRNILVLSFLLFIYNFHASAHAEAKMTRDEVCEFLMEKEDDPESERITPDKIEEAKKIVPSLIDYMQKGEDDFCAGLAMDVLGRTKDKRAFEPILAELYKEQGSLRISPIQALGNLGDPRALEPLISELQRGRTPHDQISLVVARALGGIKDARAVDPLIKLLQYDKDPSARYEAATSLGNIKDKRAIEPLIVAFQKDSNDNVKDYAAEALGEMQDPRAGDTLIAALAQEQTNSGRFGFLIRALGKQKDQRSKNALIDAYKKLKDPSAKSYLYTVMKDAGIEPVGK